MLPEKAIILTRLFANYVNLKRVNIISAELLSQSHSSGGAHFLNIGSTGNPAPHNIRSTGVVHPAFRDAVSVQIICSY